jgi:hypothetical protein
MCPRAAQPNFAGSGLDTHYLEDTTSARIGLERDGTPFRLIQKQFKAFCLIEPQ